MPDDHVRPVRPIPVAANGVLGDGVLCAAGHALPDTFRTKDATRVHP